MSTSRRALGQALNGRHRPLQAAAVYLVFGVLWILLSDRLVARSMTVDSMQSAQTVKGVLFVSASAVVIYLLVALSIRRERIAKDRFKAVFDNAPMGIALLDDQGRPHLTNRRLQEFLGRTGRELSHTRFTEFTHQDDVARDWSRYEQLVRGETDHYASERRFLRPDGQVIWGSLGVTAIRDSRGRPTQIIGMVEDIDRKKQTEARLRIAGEALENALNGYDIVSEDGLFVYANRAYLEMWGYGSLDEVVGTSPIDHCADATMPGRIVDQLDRTGEGFFEFTAKRRDGTEFEVLMAARKTIDHQGRVLYHGSSENITERKQFEAALVESEQRYRELFENMNMGFILFEVVQDDGGDAVDLVILAANEEFGHTTGLDCKAVVGQKLTEVLPGIEDDDAGWIQRYGEVALSGAPCRFEEHSDLLDTHYSVAAYRPAPNTCAVTFFDITDRKKAEAALAESEERYRLTQRLAGVGLWHWDLASGDVEWSDEVLELFGYQPDEFTGDFDAVAARVHPDDVDRWQENIRGCVENGAEHNMEFRVVRPDGSICWIGVFGDAQRDESGNATRLLGVATDVTALRQAEDQLRQSQKMEAIGRLAGGVAHDFNNQLQVISGFSELLATGLGADHRLTRHVAEIQRATEHSANLTRQLLAFSRRQALEPTVLDVNQIVGDMRTMLGRIVGEDVEISTSLADDLGSVMADRGQIEQVIVNLVINARDAMPDGGRLAIETNNAELDERYAATQIDLVPGAYTMLAVTDTGCGMDDATRAHVFEPFFTTKESGTGLGLATVFGVVKQSEGHVACYSEVGQGTTFKVYLPRVDHAVHHQPMPHSDTLSGASATILVAEDEDSVRTSIAAVLGERGFTVLTAASGHEALEMCRHHQGPIHLLLTDFVMPRMSGKDLADEFRALRPDAKVLFMSGYTDRGIVHNGRVDHGTPFLQKPFSTHALCKRIREVLET